jgi:drug/metabolite transporter (DMT)-like permease
MSSDAKALDREVSTLTLISSAAFFSTSSITMLLVNKCAFTGSSFNGGIIFVQNLFTFILAFSICSLSSSFHFEPSWQKFKTWMPCVLFFVGTIMFSASALSLINVPTFSVFRNSSSLLVAAMEYFLLQKTISRPQGFFLALLMIASLIYGWSDLQFSFRGYLFAVSHVICIALYSVGVKKLNVQFSSSLEMSIYNNAGSLSFLFAVVLYEFNSSPSEISIESKICAAASVPVSFLISWSGLISQRMFTATSWMALNNFNKLPVLLFSHIFFNDTYSVGQAVALTASVVSSVGYSYSSLSSTALDEGCLLKLQQLSFTVNAKYRRVFPVVATVALVFAAAVYLDPSLQFSSMLSLRRRLFARSALFDSSAAWTHSSANTSVILLSTAAPDSIYATVAADSTANADSIATTLSAND